MYIINALPGTGMPSNEKITGILHVFADHTKMNIAHQQAYMFLQIY